MDYTVTLPTESLLSPSDRALVKRFAGEALIEPTDSASTARRSKYLTQGKDAAEEHRQAIQEALDAFAASQPGGSASTSSISGQTQLS